MGFETPQALKIALTFGVMGYFFIAVARHQLWVLENTMRASKPHNSLNRNSFAFLFNLPRRTVAQTFLAIGWLMAVGGPAVSGIGALVNTTYGNQ
ncbi:hypothetical protein [Leisingera sp. F5]|uniref:hypothetical protein n=1 Tax=Leisingera sp. F5 TaxID=1813816 RepID=UPI000B213401|nr:hypothetical protein [Leisingera sp. F5]